MHRFIHQIEEKRQAIFVGFFGPIGVSAIFYLYLSLEFLETITVDGIMRADAKKLSEVFRVVIWFLAICSIVNMVFLPFWSLLIEPGRPWSQHPLRQTRVLPPPHSLPSIQLLTGERIHRIYSPRPAIQNKNSGWRPAPAQQTVIWAIGFGSYRPCAQDWGHDHPRWRLWSEDSRFQCRLRRP